jgi:hypothetical protein
LAVVERSPRALRRPRDRARRPEGSERTSAGRLDAAILTPPVFLKRDDTERRDLEDDLAKPVVHVLPEEATFDGRGEIAMDRRDDPDVDVEGPCEADWTDLAVAEEPEEHSLRVERELAHLVEEDRPAVGLAQEPGLPLDGPHGPRISIHCGDSARALLTRSTQMR